MRFLLLLQILLREGVSPAPIWCGIKRRFFMLTQTTSILQKETHFIKKSYKRVLSCMLPAWVQSLPQECLVNHFLRERQHQILYMSFLPKRKIKIGRFIFLGEKSMLQKKPQRIYVEGLPSLGLWDIIMVSLKTIIKLLKRSIRQI